MMLTSAVEWGPGGTQRNTSVAPTLNVDDGGELGAEQAAGRARGVGPLPGALRGYEHGAWSLVR